MSTRGSGSIKVEIIIPTLNEEQSIEDLLKSIKSYRSKFDLSILVIDGGSTDNTVEICKKENVNVIRQKRKGKGSAMREAVAQTDANVIVFMDGDGTYSIEDVGSMLEPIFKDEADMVVGSRILGTREKGSISSFNTLGNTLFNKAINFALKAKVTDSLTGYRALRKNVFEDLILFSNDFEIEVEMTVEALGKNYRIVEVPISYKARINSKTKLNPLQDGIKISKTLLFVMMNIRPILFFGVISLVFIVASGYFGGALIYERYFLKGPIYTPFAIMASLLITMGIISLVLGLLSELIVRSRRRMEYMINKKLSNNSTLFSNKP